MVGSAVQNGLRLIVVVNGLDDPDDRASEAKKMLEWGFAISKREPFSRRSRRSATPRCLAGTAARVKLASPEPIKVMVHKNGTDKLIARVVYSGPVRAPIQSGQEGRRRQGMAGRKHRRGCADLCGGIGRPGIDDAEGDRWCERARHRNVSRRREKL